MKPAMGLCGKPSPSVWQNMCDTMGIFLLCFMTREPESDCILRESISQPLTNKLRGRCPTADTAATNTNITTVIVMLKLDKLSHTNTNTPELRCVLQSGMIISNAGGRKLLTEQGIPSPLLCFLPRGTNQSAGERSGQKGSKTPPRHCMSLSHTQEVKLPRGSVAEYIFGGWGDALGWCPLHA